ncbi:MAG: c-type cytochrome [Deltaproteobacteria bacterium]|nr:c-type cytochrome [Deltaproteobacteria bacterium]
MSTKTGSVLVLVTVLAAMLGCSSSGDGGTSGSGTTGIARDGALLVLADEDNGEAVLVDTEAWSVVGTVRLDEFDGERSRPDHVTVSSDGRAYVSLMGSRAVAEIDLASRRVLRRIATPAEPRGVALSRDERTLYVASATTMSVASIDRQSGSETGRTSVPAEPRAIAVHTDGSLLVSLPRAASAVRISGAMGPLAAQYDLSTRTGARTGQVDVRPMRASTVATSPTEDEGYVLHAWASDQVITRTIPGEYYSTSQGQRVANGVTSVDLGDDTVIDDDRRMPPALTFGTPNVSSTGGFFPGGSVEPGFAGPSASVIDPSGQWLFVAGETSGTVAAIPLRRSTRASTEGGWSYAELATGDDAVGLRGLAISPDGKRLYAHSVFGRKLFELVSNGNGGIRRSRTLELPASSLGQEERIGRSLFYSSVNPRMTTTNGMGIACATCHIEGRDDGRTWIFMDGRRQTQTTAGGILSTAPFHWAGDIAAIHNLDRLVAGMGGDGTIRSADFDAIAAYIDTIPAPDMQREETTLVARGRELFESTASCAGCHAGAQLTDNQVHSVSMPGSLDTLTLAQTPSLVGVRVGAPYLHDGRAATLREVLDMSRGTGHGTLDGLSDEDLDALVAYVETL